MKLLILPLVLSLALLSGNSRAESETATPAKSVHQEQTTKKTAKARAKRTGHHVSHAFRKVGGHLQKFFTGKDTITD